MQNTSVLALLQAANYREFIRLCMQGAGSSRPLSFAELSRRAGFSSRSYPSDVVSGYRRITAASLPGFIKALKLKGDLKNYFVLLVSREETDLQPLGLAKEQVNKNLAKVRERLQSRFEGSAETSEKVYSHKYWLEIYAALGDPTSGASLAEILTKTKIAKTECAEALLKMTEAGLVRQEPRSQRYFAVENHISFDELGGAGFFRKHFISSLQELSRQATEESFSKQDRLFLTSVFSISQDRAEEFRKELRDLMVRFVDSSENPKGDSVAKLVVGFLPEIPS